MNIEELENNIKEKYSGVDIYLIENLKAVYIDTIVVPKDKRCLSIGTNIINRIIEYSNLQKKPIALLPALDYGATSMERLIRFYKRFGFVENKYLRDKRFRIKYMVKIP